MKSRLSFEITRTIVHVYGLNQEAITANSEWFNKYGGVPIGKKSLVYRNGEKHMFLPEVMYRRLIKDGKPEWVTEVIFEWTMKGIKYDEPT